MQPTAALSGAPLIAPASATSSSENETQFRFSFRVDGRSRSASVSASDDCEDKRRCSRVQGIRSVTNSFSSLADVIDSHAPSSLNSSLDAADLSYRLNELNDNATATAPLSRKGMTTTAINGVYKLMQDRRAQNHVMLHRHCISVLKDNQDESFFDDAGSSKADSNPIVALFFASSSHYKHIPAGLEAVRHCEMRLGNEVYRLYVKRLSSVTSQDNLAYLRPISDVQIIASSLEEHIPMGYECVLTTVTGELIPLHMESPPSVLLCFSRCGNGIVRNLAVVSPASTTHSGTMPLSEHVVLRQTPWARSANLKLCADEADTFLCVSKSYGAYAMPSSCLKSRPELKYLSPLLLGCHIHDGAVATTALSYLSALTSGGFFFDAKQPSGQIYIEIVVSALCDAAFTVPSKDYYSRLLQCITLLVSHCGMDLPVGCFFDFVVCAFQAQDRRGRRLLFESIFERCFQAYEPSSDTSASHWTSVHMMASSIMNECRSNVERSKQVENLLKQFISYNESDHELRHSVISIAELLFQKRAGRALAVTTLVLCRAASTDKLIGRRDFNGRSLTLRDALLGLRKMLRKALEFRCVESKLAYLVRQFIFPVALRALVYGVDDVFRISLDLLKFLWHEKTWLHFVQAELCAIFEIGVFSILTKRHVSVLRRQIILEALSDMLDQPQIIIDVFYNFDNIRCWAFFESLISCLCRCADQVRKQSQLTPHNKMLLALQRRVIDLLVRVMCSIHDWYFERCGDFTQRVTTSNAPPQYQSHASPCYSVIGSRRGTVSMRFSKQKKVKEQRDKALGLAMENGVHRGVAYMIAVNLIDANADAIATFLHENLESIDPSGLGEYLGGTRTAAEEPMEEEIRLAYIRRFEYPVTDIVSALRLLLTEQGFRLPVETQKIERLLNCFGVVYYEQNRNRFHEPDACLVLSFLLLLLNTSLHNPNVKPTDQMRLETFLASCHTIHCSYSDLEFERMYNLIVREPFAISMMRTGETALQRQENVERENAKEAKRIIRQVNARILSVSALNLTFFTATSIETVASMFEIAWFQFLTVLESMLASNDMRLVPAAMNGFNHAIALAIGLNFSTETDSLVKQLIKSVGARHAAAPIDDNAVNDSEFQKKLLLLLLSDPLDAIRYVDASIEVMKKEFIRDTNKLKLCELQSSFTSDVMIMHPDRAYLGQGDIHKLTKKYSNRRYRLFLFSDSMLYASGNSSRFKVHRVVQLPFCSIENIEDSPGLRFAFRVVNPQKTFVLFCESSEDKDEWIDEISDAIRQAQKRRERLIEAAHSLQRAGRLDPDIVNLLSMTSAFIGKTESMLDDVQKRFHEYDDRCKLCYKTFSIFTRKHVCMACRDVVCNACASISNTSSSTNDGSDKLKQRLCCCCAQMISSGLVAAAPTTAVPVVAAATAAGNNQFYPHL